MDVIRKDATITNTDDAFPGSFEVVLSAPTRDRDGDLLLPEEWKTPLPEHITFDIDHGMSVDKTVGSGRPRIDEQGRLIVAGNYSSLDRAQEVRTLVNEGHINRTSVAFMTEKTHKDGKPAVVRELLNGAFVAIPSNREAVVLSAKAALKAGARNSRSDADHIQAIHDHALALGAVPHTGTGEDGADIAAAKSVTVKDPDTEDASSPGVLAAAADAAVDSAIDLLARVDPESLPAEVQQAIALIQAADAALDELLDALGVADPDEDATDAAAGISTAAAAKAAAAAETPTAAEGTDSTEIQTRAARFRLFSLISER